MPSSISSSRRQAWLAVTVVLLAILGLEAFTRIVLWRMSKDFALYTTYPARASALAKARGAVRVAVFGNSAVERGVDPSVLGASLTDALSRPAMADRFYVAGSSVNTWRWVLEKYFWGSGRRADLYVVVFFANTIEDGNPVESGVLAQFFTSPRNWREVVTQEMPDGPARLEYGTSLFWATFAGRDRLKDRILSVTTPKYRDLKEWVNAQNFDDAQQGRLDAGGEKPAFRALSRLLSRAREVSAKVVFVAFPTYEGGRRPPYALAPELVSLVERSGQTLIDMRDMPGLAAGDYESHTHLNQRGCGIFSAALAKRLAPLIH